MSDDWQVGDRALCVDDRPCPFYGTNGGLVLGRIYRVSAVFGRGVGGRSELFGRCVGLYLDGIPNVAIRGASATRFRKIKPDAEPCEAEFVTLIKRMKPAKVSS